MKKQLIAMVSLVGTLSVLSACTSNEDITFPAMISPLALDVETCSSQAKSDFQSGVAALKIRNTINLLSYLLRRVRTIVQMLISILQRNIITDNISQKTLGWQKKNLNRLVIKG